ncbi:bifunctional phosphoribosyl-AMP cyclohydrolase/phosphoribosyl-ATP diphosphatase HisIE [Pseudomonadota bacterium]
MRFEIDKLNWNKGNELIPAIIQDSRTLQVLMLGYMNKESLKKTIKDKKVTFFSRTKQRLWQKGEESGNFLNVIEITSDCDADTLLIKVEPEGPTCHLGNTSCFDKEEASGVGFIATLERIVEDRFKNPTKESYTSSLFEKGIHRIVQKVGEEATEVVISAMSSKDEEFENEVADLIFHLLVLLKIKDVKFEDIIEVLMKRHKKK